MFGCESPHPAPVAPAAACTHPSPADALSDFMVALAGRQRLKILHAREAVLHHVGIGILQTELRRAVCLASDIAVALDGAGVETKPYWLVALVQIESVLEMHLERLMLAEGGAA